MSAAPAELFCSALLSGGAICPGETPFQYLSRSERAHAVLARETLNRLWKDFPPASKQHLYARLTAKDESAFEAAVFELYVHEVFRSLGFDIEVNPQIDQGLTPDFRVTNANSLSTIVECTVIRESSATSKLAKRIHQLNMEASPLITVQGFAVGLSLAGSRVSDANPSARKFALFLNDWFTQARYSTMVPRSRDYCEPEGWRLKLYLIDLNSNEKLAQVIAGQASAAWTGDVGEVKLRDAIAEKVRRYKSCERLVVAIAFNDFANLPDLEEIKSVLYGATDTSRDGSKTSSIWDDAASALGQNLIGVMLVPGCYPSGLNEAAPNLWDNPYLRKAELLVPWTFSRFPVE
ncbi:MAG: hypothetical protein IT449_11145 [Phycisphaerales bacterium]|nr:hypothetical protein [Phycisphaerales bacterium]